MIWIEHIDKDTEMVAIKRDEMGKEKEEGIHAVLASVQQKLVAPKNQYNSFGKYKYRSCEDILEGVKKVMPANCSLTITDEVTMIGERYYVKATATFSTQNESVSVSASAREAATKKGMDESQITGSASSYARKYALNGLFCIDDTKDADSRAPSKTEYYYKIPETHQKIEKIKEMFSNFEIDDGFVCITSGAKIGLLKNYEVE